MSTRTPKTLLRFPRPAGLDPRTPHCPSCGTENPEAFYKNKTTGHGYQEYCLSCHATNFSPGRIPLALQLERERRTEEREKLEVLALIAERNALKAFLGRVESAFSLDDLCALERELPSGSEDAARSALDSRLLALDSLDCAAQ